MFCEVALPRARISTPGPAGRLPSSIAGLFANVVGAEHHPRMPGQSGDRINVSDKSRNPLAMPSTIGISNLSTGSLLSGRCHPVKPTRFSCSTPVSSLE
ncbi:hypothetical protein LY78DRAFT_466774 [Colletotrichum sublineola]|nr:hypothetical protein LY78DRAFT_466774 [Colletotrichum sublineola]